jgi:hypothetical protein
MSNVSLCSYFDCQVERQKSDTNLKFPTLRVSALKYLGAANFIAFLAFHIYLSLSHGFCELWNVYIYKYI